MARAVGSWIFLWLTPNHWLKLLTLLSGLSHSRIRESGFAFISNMAKVYGSGILSGFLEEIVPQILKCLEQKNSRLILMVRKRMTSMKRDSRRPFKQVQDQHRYHHRKGNCIRCFGRIGHGNWRCFCQKYVEPSVKTFVRTNQGLLRYERGCYGTLSGRSSVLCSRLPTERNLLLLKVFLNSHMSMHLYYCWLRKSETLPSVTWKKNSSWP